MVAIGTFFVAIILLGGRQLRRQDQRYAPRQLALLVMCMLWWMSLGLSFIVAQAARSSTPSLPLLIPTGLVLVSWNLLGWPVWWRRLGDANAWHGDAPTLADPDAWRREMP